MASVFTIVKVVLGIVVLLLFLSIVYLVVNSENVKSYINKMMKQLNATNPRLANFLSSVGNIFYKICEIAYSITKPAVDTVNNLLDQISSSLSGK